MLIYYSIIYWFEDSCYAHINILYYLFLISGAPPTLGPPPRPGMQSSQPQPHLQQSLGVQQSHNQPPSPSQSQSRLPPNSNQLVGQMAGMNINGQPQVSWKYFDDFLQCFLMAFKCGREIKVDLRLYLLSIATVSHSWKICILLCGRWFLVLDSSWYM